jgi:solute carrier family 35 protein E1
LFVAIATILPVLMQLWNKRRRGFTRKQYIHGLAPLVTLKLASNLSSFITLSKVPVSFAATVKALMPFFSVAISRVILGTKFNWSIYFSLIVVVGGVLLTTATMEEFNLYGLCAAIFSTMSLAVQSIFSKKVMKGIDPLNLLLGTTQLCCVVLFPFWYIHEGHNMIFGDGLAGLGSSIEFSGVFLELIGASIANCTALRCFVLGQGLCAV